MTEHLPLDQDFIRKLTDIVLTNIRNENFGVGDLVREAGISRITIHRKIKSIKNQDASQFIREIRLRRAMELLQQNAGTVSEIAFMVGFGSPAYFNKCFHEFYGFPPGKVKKEALRNTEEITTIEVVEANVQKKPEWRTYILVLAGILFFAVLLCLGYIFISDNSRFLKANSPYEPGRSVAVLPFRNLTDSLSNQYFIDGITEDVRANLSKIHDLRVISETSTEQFRKSIRPESEIARRLNVNYIIEGSVQKYGNTFNLRISLIDAVKDRQIWSHSYKQENHETGDIFKMQNQIAQAIATELEAKITDEEKHIIEKMPTSSVASYDLFMKANEYRKNYQVSRNLNDYSKGVNLYEAALAIDSTFAKAYTGLAFAYYERYSWEKYFKEGYMDTCLFLVNKALKIDNDLDEAYYLRGLYYFSNGKMQDALDSFDKAININPSYYEAYERKGYILVWILHDNVKGIDSHNKALSLLRGNDRSPLLWELGHEYDNIGFIEKAKDYFREAFALENSEVHYLGYSAWLEFSLENFNESYKLFKKVHELDSTSVIDQILYCIPPGHEREAYLLAEKIIRLEKKVGSGFINNSHRVGYALWQEGKVKEAKYYFNQQIKYCEESIKLNREYALRNYASYDLAATYAFLGEKEKAYKYLDDFDRNKSCQLIWLSVARHDPLFGSIRNEERFKKILKNMETKYLAEHERVKKWLEEQGML
jgi:TolB-like protein/AraC-like DNA-binding protein